MTDLNSIAQYATPQLVPAGYAEKAMASLMQLHSELMDEKERRVELFRRLMEREQALAELRMYVKMLEERAATAPVAQAAPMPPPMPEAQPESRAPAPVQVAPPRTPPDPSLGRPSRAPPVPPAVGNRPRPDGWRAW